MDGWGRYLFWIMLDSYPQEKLVNFSVSKLETNTGTKTSQCCQSNDAAIPSSFSLLYMIFFYPFNSRFFS